MNHSGRVRLWKSLSSSWRAWPVECTSAMPLCTTSAPSRTSPFCTRLMFASFPGMGVEDRITVSAGPILMKRFSLAAINASAE